MFDPSRSDSTRLAGRIQGANRGSSSLLATSTTKIAAPSRAHADLAHRRDRSAQLQSHKIVWPNDDTCLSR